MGKIPFKKFLGDALDELYPNSSFRVFDTLDDIEIDVVIDNDTVSLRASEMEAEYDSQEYARNRKQEYDQLNQFEMQFDDDRDSTTTWVDKINEIKGRHPK